MRQKRRITSHRRRPIGTAIGCSTAQPHGSLPWPLIPRHRRPGRRRRTVRTKAGWLLAAGWLSHGCGGRRVRSVCPRRHCCRRQALQACVYGRFSPRTELRCSAPDAHRQACDGLSGCRYCMAVEGTAPSSRTPRDCRARGGDAGAAALNGSVRMGEVNRQFPGCIYASP